MLPHWLLDIPGAAQPLGKYCKISFFYFHLLPILGHHGNSTIQKIAFLGLVKIPIDPAGFFFQGGPGFYLQFLKLFRRWFFNVDFHALPQCTNGLRLILLLSVLVDRPPELYPRIDEYHDTYDP